MCPLLMAPLIHEKPEDTQDITAGIKGWRDLLPFRAFSNRQN